MSKPLPCICGVAMQPSHVMQYKLVAVVVCHNCERCTRAKTLDEAIRMWDAAMKPEAP